MVPTELCLRYIARPILQNAYQGQSPFHLTSTYGIRLHAKVPKKKPPFKKTLAAPKHVPSAKSQPPGVAKQTLKNQPPGIPNQTAIKSTAPKFVPKPDSGLSKYRNLVKPKTRDLSSDLNSVSKAAELKKSRIAVPRLRLTIGVIFIGSIIYSMVHDTPFFLCLYTN